MKAALATSALGSLLGCGLLTLAADVGWSRPIAIDRFETSGSPATGYDLKIPGAPGGTGPGAMHLDPGYMPGFSGDMVCPPGNPSACAMAPGAAAKNLGYAPLNKNGDTMGRGAVLNFVLSGAPTFASLSQMLADVGAFYGNGGRADGGSHPLSDITSFNGLRTTGFTLGQWQALFRQQTGTGVNPVQGLSDEIDQVALQAVVNRPSATSSQVLYLPSGYISLARPIQSGCTQLSVRGAGKYSTFLVQRGLKQDGWHHGTPDTRCVGGYGVSFSIEDLSFVATNFGGTALKIQGNHNWVGYLVENI